MCSLAGRFVQGYMPVMWNVCMYTSGHGDIICYSKFI